MQENEQIAILQSELESTKNSLEVEREDFTKFREELAGMLNPCIADVGDIKKNVKDLVGIQEKLRQAENKQKQIREEADKKVTTFMEEIQKLKGDLETQVQRNNTLQIRVEKLEIKGKEMQANHSIHKVLTGLFTRPKQEPQTGTRFQQFIRRFV